MKNNLNTSEKTLIALLLYVLTGVSSSIGSIFVIIMFSYIGYLIYEDYKEEKHVSSKTKIFGVLRPVLSLVIAITIFLVAF